MLPRLQSTSPEDFAGDRPEPVLRIGGLQFANILDRIERACAPSAFDLRQQPGARLVDAGDRDAVTRRDQAVAGVDKLRLRRLPFPQQGDDSRGAGFWLGVGAEGGFRHRAADRRVPDDMDARPKTRLERDRIDWAPAGLVRDAGRLRYRARPLRRDAIDDVGFVAVELSHQRLRRRIDFRHPAVRRQRHPFDQAGIEFSPGRLENRCLDNASLASRMISFERGLLVLR